MTVYDAIVVGAGCAGSVAAYELAKAGKDVLLIDRGIQPGNKNMTGGRMYVHALKEVFPDCEKEAPFERKVTHERISMISDDADFTIDYTSNEMNTEGADSYTVLRAKFDPWLASKATDAGAKPLYGSAVTSLTKDDTGKINGVVVDGQTYNAQVVILTDGINSLLINDAVGAKTPTPDTVAVGLKEVFKLDPKTISDRCNVGSDDEGTAWLFVGDATKGSFGGGFIYANKDTISLGLVVGIEAAATTAVTPVYQMLEDFKTHPMVAAIIEGGEVVEYSAHMIPEGGYDAMPDLVGDGVLIAGDNAFMCLNLGFQVRGMDFAVAAGMHAGQCAAEALDKGDTSKEGLQNYISALNDCFVLKQLQEYRKSPQFLEQFTEMFTTYPEAIAQLLNTMFIVGDGSSKPMKDSVEELIKKVGLFHLLKDTRGAMKEL